MKGGHLPTAVSAPAGSQKSRQLHQRVLLLGPYHPAQSAFGERSDAFDRSRLRDGPAHAIWCNTIGISFRLDNRLQKRTEAPMASCWYVCRSRRRPGWGAPHGELRMPSRFDADTAFGLLQALRLNESPQT